MTAFLAASRYSFRKVCRTLLFQGTGFFPAQRCPRSISHCRLTRRALMTDLCHQRHNGAATFSRYQGCPERRGEEVGHVPHKHRHSKQSARLDEVLALFGHKDEIAPTDIERFGRRAGELIARDARPIRSSPPHKRGTSIRTSKRSSIIRVELRAEVPRADRC